MLVRTRYSLSFPNHHSCGCSLELQDFLVWLWMLTIYSWMFIASGILSMHMATSLNQMHTSKSPAQWTQTKKANRIAEFSLNPMHTSNTSA